MRLVTSLWRIAIFSGSCKPAYVIKTWNVYLALGSACDQIKWILLVSASFRGYSPTLRLMKFESRETRTCTRMQIGLIYESGYSRVLQQIKGSLENPSVHKLESHSIRVRGQFYYSLFMDIRYPIARNKNLMKTIGAFSRHRSWKKSLRIFDDRLFDF